MIGSEGVTRAVVRRLRAALPGQLADLRTRLQIDARALPDVALIEPDEFDILSVDQYPAIFVVPVDTTGRLDNRQTESAGSYDEYSFTYNVQVYIYARGEDFKSTSAMTKRYTLATRECLLQKKLLLDGTENLSLEPRTLREVYSQISRSPNTDRFLGGAYIELQVVSEERVAALHQSIEVAVEHREAATTARSELPAWNLDV